MKMKLYLLVMMVSLFTGSGVQAQSAGQKTLVVYFSQSGNTRAVAEQIKNAIGADVFEIHPVKAYPTEYNTLTEQAKKEISSGVKPGLRNKVTDMDKYDVIFVGSPCWWSTIAPPVATFLSSYNFSGKTIVPFMTHGGSRMGHSEADIKKLCPRSAVLKGLPVAGSRARNAKADIAEWLREIKLVK